MLSNQPKVKKFIFKVVFFSHGKGTAHLLTNLCFLWEVEQLVIQELFSSGKKRPTGKESNKWINVETRQKNKLVLIVYFHKFCLPKDSVLAELVFTKACVVLVWLVSAGQICPFKNWRRSSFRPCNNANRLLKASKLYGIRVKWSFCNYWVELVLL